MNGVSIIIPAYNAERTIAECLTAIQHLGWAGELETILVNDGSTDRTAEIAAGFAGVRVISTANGGVSRARNIGIKAANYDIVVSTDADITLDRDWLSQVIPYFDAPEVGAVTGYALTRNTDLVGKLTGYHYELRQSRMPLYVDAVGNGNTAYRRQTIIQVGLFDEGVEVGEDTDMSQRLTSAGYRLVFNKDARCQHYWRDNLRCFLKQQYNYARSHLDFVRKYDRTHNQVSNLGLVLQIH